MDIALAQKGGNFMKKVYLLSGIIAFGTILSLNTMQYDQQTANDVMYKLIHNQRNINWNAVFSILDSMQKNAAMIFVNTFRYSGKISLLTLAVLSVGNSTDENALSIVETLLKIYNADPNVLNASKGTALFYACLNQNIPLIKLLVHYGADFRAGKPPVIDYIAKNAPGFLPQILPLMKPRMQH